MNRRSPQPAASATGGFTLLELLIYLAVISTVLLAATSFSFQFLATRAKAAAYQEVERNAQLVVARMAAEVRQSAGINGVTATSLSLATDTPATNPTVFSVSGGLLTVQQGAGPVLPLNSSKVRISEFVVDNLSTGSGRSKLVRIHVKASFVSDLQIYAADAVAETTAQVKKADGFSN